ncbi:MAG TPA: sarcosine oxidase subunit alpha family protein [Casimicrobiaceae bacterium]|nr:sarcosine oxidase subunit alpha family protein [Casimicrobiaceae bacterium]
MTQSHRLPEGGIVDRSRPLHFVCDGVSYEGYAGDTVASALLANGVHLVARSFKYHRPRGIYTAGVEEPNALLQIGEGARTEPNVRATVQPLYGGLVAASQNRWPSLRFDIGAINDVASRLIPAGFYYKTFMWPPTPKAWMRYENAIRRAAGMGIAPSAPDPDHYEHQYAHCDVLVIGAGPAGLAAARAAAHAGARVIVCDENPVLGGGLLGSEARIDEGTAAAWVDATTEALGSRAGVTLLPRTSAFGWYDGNLVGLCERVGGAASASTTAPRERLWKVRARAIVLAAGAHERGIAYANNDLPGTLLAGAARCYVERYAVRPGTRAVVVTNNDSAYASAIALARAGIAVASVVDARSETTLRGELPRKARESGLAIVAGAAIAGAHGRLRVTAVDIAPLAGGAPRHIECDLVCASGGWNPAVHLFAQARGRLRYDTLLATFVPDGSPLPIAAAGAANGVFDLAAALVDGHRAGCAAAAQAGATAATPIEAPRAAPLIIGVLQPLWRVEPLSKGAKCFVDLQNDVTTADIALAAREGYRSVEHLKRYTTLGMGTDQGKTSNVVGLALLAEAVGQSIAQVGTTTFRPPYAPVTLGTLPGHAVGADVEPTRHSAMHDWHVEHGARFVNASLWKRPHSYPRTGESGDDAANREARNVRTNVGIVDVSTLGKIEIQGRDAAELLNRVYINRWDTLAVGRCRYGVMLRDDGMVLDDGTTSRLGPTHYLMTTTTVNAVKVMQHLYALLQIDWPELEVFLASVTEQWAAAALSGPRARDVLARVVDIDVSNAAFPFLAVGGCHVRASAGPIPARLFRLSYSGELAYEIHVPADRGREMWEAVVAAGESFGVMPYGTEAMSTLRIEKGHVVVGPEADGRTTAGDLGMGNLVNAAKWCVGKPMLARSALTAVDRWQLVGLTALDGAKMPRAAKIVADPDHPLPNPMLGHVTSWCWSPNLDAWIALALVANGRARHGETLWAVSPLANARVRVKVGAPCFIDPEGGRLRV